MSNIYSHVKTEEVKNPHQIFKLFQKSGVVEMNNTHEL